MHNAPLFLTRGAGATLVDGIDVGQLLQGLGEASAISNPVELFGLCLVAQRVLDQVSTASASASVLSADEAAVLAAYRALNGQQRHIMLDFARAYAEQPERQRPLLSLVHSLQPGGVQ